MKPSGRWQKRRLKYVATLNDEALSETTDPDYELQYIDIGNVDSSGSINKIESYRFENAPSRARRIVRDGDVIISTVRTYLQAIAPIIKPQQNLIVSTGFSVIRPRREILSTEFCKYVLRELCFLCEVESRSVGVSYPAINSSELGTIRVEVPPINEQYRIANYLDEELAQIDTLIAEKEQMLQLLEEKRAALVSRIVTQGLHPNTPMKPSGLGWLGDIPAHWEVIRFKHFATIGNGSTPNRDQPHYWEGGSYPWLNSSVVNSRKIGNPSRYVTEEALTECHLPKIDPPALLVAITGQGKTRGRSAVLEFGATINQHLAFVKPAPSAADCLFLSFLLDTAYSFIRSDSDSSGSTRGAITCEQLGNFYVTLPPLDEQLKIVLSIEEHTSIIGKAEEALRCSIALLKERRSALITAAVTGQLDLKAMSV